MSVENPIPEGAKNLAMSPDFRKIALNLKTYEVLGFSSDYPDFIRLSDKNEAYGYLQRIALFQLIGLSFGIMLNVQVKKVYPRILTMGLFPKLTIRSFLLLGPFEAAYQLFSKPERQKLNILISKIHRRIVAFGYDGDLHRYFHS